MGKVEGGSGTRRRPIGRDYAAAKDAECGKNEIGFLKTNEIKLRSGATSLFDVHLWKQARMA
jgi:hypothetical protein